MPNETAVRITGFHPPSGPGTERAHTGRIASYLLGGKDHFSADRTAGDRIRSRVPGAAGLLRAGREFQQRAVRAMAADGIWQFIHVGAGFPEPGPATSEIAREHHPAPRIVFVDHDPVIVTHTQALLDLPGVTAIWGDLRNPRGVFETPDIAMALDLTQPVGVVLAGVLHFVSRAYDPRDIVAAIRYRVAPGSLIAISHWTRTGSDPAALDGLAAGYAQTDTPVEFRTADEIAQLFDFSTLLEPGLVDVAAWRPDVAAPPAQEPPGVRCLAGVARLPA